MSVEELGKSLEDYKSQLQIIETALTSSQDEKEKQSLQSLQSDMKQLIQLTEESLTELQPKEPHNTQENTTETNDVDDEYKLFMEEMAKSGAYDNKDSEQPFQEAEKNDDSDVEDELATLLGMKCAVYHTHTWGGEPTLHNAMVSTVVPRQGGETFKDLQVRVLFTHPTHAEMLPCPFYLDGDCRFSDEQCRYSHGAVINLSDLKEAIEPDFESVKENSRILVKIKPPKDEDISLTKKSTEKYHLWHRAIVRGLDLERKICVVKLEHRIKTGEKRKSDVDEISVSFEDIFPLNNDALNSSDSDDSLSDTEYPETKMPRANEPPSTELIAEHSLHSGPALGQWERHTRGIGSKLMLAMGYVPGEGLGAGGEGRLQPVEARVVPRRSTLDRCMEISERSGAQDPFKVEQKLKRMQKKEEERNKRAYEREKERERRNVFNFLNKTLGDKQETEESNQNDQVNNIKQSTNKDLNIEQFKITEETKRIEKEIVKLKGSLQRHAAGTSGHSNLNNQINERNKELNVLKNKEQQISKEQRHRKDKQKLTVF